jgi:hypothetical protein
VTDPASLLPVNRSLMDAAERVYDRPDGLGGARDCALGVCCPSAKACWGDRQDPHRTHGSIFPPWIGAEYRPGGVCVVGLNLRIGTGDGTYWDIERKVASDQYASLAAGRSSSKGSHWASSTMRDAALVLRSIAGRSLDEPTTGAERAETLQQTARVQTVKCSPGQGRGTPLRQMAINCPPRYLRHELDVLRPSVLLVYGRVPAAAMRGLADSVEVAERAGKRFRRIGLRFGGWTCTGFMLTHPAHGGWHRDHALLRMSLAQQPIPAT